MITDGFPDVTVLFADVVDFTRRSERDRPEQVVEALNDLFRQRLHGRRRARPSHVPTTPRRWPRWPWRCWRKEVAGRFDLSGQPLQVRIGIDTGPVMAGVIGTSRFSYDLWATPQYGQPHGVPRGP